MCRDCSDCKDADRTEFISLKEEVEMDLIDKSVEQGALKPGSVGALLPGNLLSHRKFEVELGNNARNFLSPQSVVTFLLLF